MGIRNGVQRKNKNPETKQRIKKKIRITKIAIAPIKIIKVDIVTTKQTLKSSIKETGTHSRCQHCPGLL